jgi:AcrR family transcriptional regulator
MPKPEAGNPRHNTTARLARKRDMVRQEIGHAAWLLFAARGYERTTVSEVARKAGVSRRTFFRYFASKEDVVVETTDALAEDFLAAFASRRLDEPPIVSIQRALRPVVLGWLEDASRMQAIIRQLRESPTLRRAALERHARMEERLAALIARRTGTNLLKDPTPALLAFVARALMDTAFNVWYDQRPKDAGAMVDGLFERLRDVVVRRGRKHAARKPAAMKGRAVRAGLR